MKPPTEEIFRTHGNRLYSAAYAICQNREDAEDAMQDTLMRYSAAKKEFESGEHVKAWLLRVVINRARDIRSSFWRKNQSDWQEEMANIPFEEPGDSRLFQAVMELPETYRAVIHLYYYEDYDIREIAGLLRCPGGTIKSRLSRGRALLKQKLKGDWNDD